MRLFGKVNSTIDRFDRAGWLTVPFDLSARAGAGHGHIFAAVGFTQGVQAAAGFTQGMQKSATFQQGIQSAKGM